MVTYKGCQIVKLGDKLGRYAIKSKIYQNAYAGFGNYGNCKKIIYMYDGQFKLLEQRTGLNYSRLDGTITPTSELEPITKKGGNK